MPHIKIESGDGAVVGRPVHGSRTKLFIDGKQVNGVQSVDVRYDTHSAVTATIRLFAYDGLSLDSDMNVQFTIVAMPGMELVETLDPDTGARHIRARVLPPGQV